MLFYCLFYNIFGLMIVFVITVVLKQMRSKNTFSKKIGLQAVKLLKAAVPTIVLKYT